MYRDQFGEFVCGYWAERVLTLGKLPNLKVMCIGASEDIALICMVGGKFVPPTPHPPCKHL